MTAHALSQTVTHHELSCDGYMHNTRIKCGARWQGGSNYPSVNVRMDAIAGGWRCDDTGDWCPDHKDAPAPAPLPDLSELVHDAQQRILDKRFAHLEMFAAAYLARTDIDPRDAVLVQKHEGLTTRWWFEPKGAR